MCLHDLGKGFWGTLGFRGLGFRVGCLVRLSFWGFWGLWFGVEEIFGIKSGGCKVF